MTLSENEAEIVLEGEVDVSTAPQFRNQMQLAIESGVKRLICDLAEVRYIDSTGLSVLIMAHKRLESDGGTFAVVAPTPNVRRLFEISGVDKFLEIKS